MRPLISTGDPKKSVDISRKAELYETSSGMVTITGGKLTTWRRMAKMTVDRLVEREAREAPCRTHEIPLGQAVDPADLPRVEGVPPEAYEQLASRYGHAAHDVLAVAAERGELAQPILGTTPGPGGPARRDGLQRAARAGDARSATRCCAAPARRCSPRARSAIPAARRRCASRAPWRRSSDGTRRARRREAQAFLDEAAAEGIVARDGRSRLPSFLVNSATSTTLRRGIAAACALVVLAPVAPAAAQRTPGAFYPGQPVDGPSTDVRALGGIDMARDGGGASPTCAATAGRTTSFVSDAVGRRAEAAGADRRRAAAR